MSACIRCGTEGGGCTTHICVSGFGMNLEVERHPGELAELREEVAAWRSLHNGYDANMRAAMPDLKEPASPQQALRELIDEAVAVETAELRRFKAGADALVEKWRDTGMPPATRWGAGYIEGRVTCANELAALSKEVGSE